MTIAVCVMVSLIAVWGAHRLRSARRRSALSGQQQTLGQLERLLRELEDRGDGRSVPRQELAAVRGGTPRQHVWCAPGGEEVFLN